MNAENLLRYLIEIAQAQLRVSQQNLENHNTRWRGVEREGGKPRLEAWQVNNPEAWQSYFRY